MCFLLFGKGGKVVRKKNEAKKKKNHEIWYITIVLDEIRCFRDCLLMKMQMGHKYEPSDHVGVTLLFTCCIKC